MHDYRLPDVRRENRTRLIEGWFRDIDSAGGAGLVLQTWEAFMPPDEWWELVLDMIRLAPEDCLGRVAAGPLENLLSRYGDDVIDQVEAESRTDPRFARTLRGVYRMTMSDQIWHRVSSLRSEQ
jgi:hypothetical protein